MLEATARRDRGLLVAAADQPDAGRPGSQRHRAGLRRTWPGRQRPGRGIGHEPLAPPRGADPAVGLQRLLAQRCRPLVVAEPRAGPGQGVVGDPVEHHGAGVDHRPAGVGHQQRGDRRDQVFGSGRQGDVEQQLQLHEVVVVARQVRQHPLVEGRREPAGVVGQPEAGVQPRDLGPDLPHPLVAHELLARAEPLERALALVAGLHRAVGDHAADHERAVRELIGHVLGQRDQPLVGVDAPVHQVEHQPTGGRVEQRLARLLAQPLERAHLPVDPREVEGLRGDLEQPQVRRGARLRPHQVRGRVREFAGQVDPDLELVGPPVRGQRRVERVGQHLRVAGGLGVPDRRDREGRGAAAFAGVRPAPGQGRPEQGPLDVGRGGVVGLEEHGGDAARLGAEDVGTGEVERFLRARADLAGVHGRHRDIRGGAASRPRRAGPPRPRPSPRCSRR